MEGLVPATLILLFTTVADHFEIGHVQVLVFFLRFRCLFFFLSHGPAGYRNLLVKMVGQVD